MTYEQIETFLIVATYKNITAASKYLFVSQSTVSSRLQQLEDELGTPLLIRHKGQRNAELTNYGSAFIPIASQWASLWKDTQHLKALPDIKSLNIASVDAVNNYTLVPMFQKHLEDHPRVKLSIMTYHSSEIYSLVQNRTADIGFAFSSISYPDVIAIPVYRELMYLICNKKSNYGDNIACKDLPVEKEIYLRWGSDYQQWHDRHWSPGVYPLISVNTGSMLQRYLDYPDNWAIAPMSVIQGAMRSNPELTFHSLKEPPAPRICYEIKNRFPNVTLLEPIELLEKELQEFIEEDESICSFESWMLNS